MGRGKIYIFITFPSFKRYFNFQFSSFYSQGKGKTGLFSFYSPGGKKHVSKLAKCCPVCAGCVHSHPFSSKFTMSAFTDGFPRLKGARNSVKAAWKLQMLDAILNDFFWILC